MSQLMNVYSIYDEKACAFNVPFFCVSDGVAVRNFTDLALDPRSMVHTHPEDFSLYCIGSFVDDTALLAPSMPVRLICRTADVLQQARGAAVGGESPLKSQSDLTEDCESNAGE